MGSVEQKLIAKIMKYFLLILFFYCTLFSIVAQNSMIDGFAPTYKGQKISLYAYADYISNTEIPVAVETINDSGLFNFSFQTSEIKRVVLRCGKQKANMYIEPTHNYKILFPARDTIRFVNPNIEQQVELTFAVTDTTEINSLIIDYNRQFEIFWENNFQYFVQKKSRSRLDTFELQMRKRYAPLNKSYFNSYIDYSMAELDLSTFQSKTGLVKKYLTDKPILYNNYEYMSFLNKFFTHYLYTYASSYNGPALIEQLNEKASYEGCMNVFAGDKILRNDSLRELVLIKGLGELYYCSEFSRKNIVTILEQIASSTKIATHKDIAGNVLHSFSKLQVGAPAPEFSLLDKTGKQINLSDFRGKFVYLDFWATWCTPCLQEMKLIPNLKKKYGDKIVFVSISTDEDTLAVKKFLAKNPKYDWVLLHYGQNKQVKEDYEIKSIPMCFLINPSGNFYQSPALRPSQSIETTFLEITKKRSDLKQSAPK